MTEQGTVVKVYDKMALVLVARKSACDSCEAKACCRQDGEKVEIEALNAVDAQVGDSVIIDMSGSSVFTSGFLLYTIPVVFLFAGILAGGMIAGFFKLSAELFSLITGFSMLIISFVFLKFSGKGYFKKQKFLPKIVEIIK